jgi:hypothetical protein
MEVLVRPDGTPRTHPLMISAGIFARREAELKLKEQAGQLTEADKVGYLRTAAFTLGMALELYRYEYGKLPESAEELVAQEYLNALPGNPYSAWSPLPVRFESAHPEIKEYAGLVAAGLAQPGVVLVSATGSILVPDPANATDPANKSFAFEFSPPAEVWLQTEAKMHGMEYQAYEEQLSRQYADRALWPASGIVTPIPPPATAMVVAPPAVQ